eukprot:5599687-Alexandrium_andersonii.AAC.1
MEQSQNTHGTLMEQSWNGQGNSWGIQGAVVECHLWVQVRQKLFEPHLVCRMGCDSAFVCVRTCSVHDI